MSDDELLGALQTPKQKAAQDKLVTALNAIVVLICEKHEYNPALCMQEAHKAGQGIERVLQKAVVEFIRLHKTNKAA